MSAKVQIILMLKTWRIFFEKMRGCLWRKIFLYFCRLIPRGLQARHVSTQGERSEPYDYVKYKQI